MGCNCLERRKDIDVVRRNAKTFAKMNRQNMQIYQREIGIGLIYDFEPVNDTRKDIVEIVQWED